ncbi:MAG TPA: hypothetical protein VGC36_06580 [Rhizomicrobium sp.]
MGFAGAYRRGVLAIAFLLLAVPANAASPELRKAANIITIALPVSAIGVSLMHDRDWRGIKEFALSAGLTVGSAYLIRHLVRERRPDHSDFHTLTPPDLALADASADYLWSRYGWRYGVPSYLASALVSYALTDNKKNHWYDTVASGALAFGFNYAIVDRYRPGRYRVTAETTPNGAMLRFAIRF